MRRDRDLAEAEGVAGALLAAATLAFNAFVLQDVYYDREYYALPRFTGAFQPLIHLFGPSPARLGLSGVA